MIETMSQPVLEVRDLAIDYKIGTEWKTAVRDINFTIGEGESFGLVGESGCGKTTVAMAIMHYLSRNGRVSNGSIVLAGRDITSLSRKELRDARINDMSMVYQDPASALNPSIKIGKQVADVFDLLGVPRDEQKDRVIEVLRKVQIADPGRVAERYPHQLSGGMLQRVVIAMAIASEPATTALSPSSNSASPRTVAVVVPSPATSDALEAISLTIWTPMFS